MMMLKGVGTDLVEVARLKRSIEDRGDAIAQRVLTDKEFQDYLDSNRKPDFLAKRFAIKEAVSKALGTGIAQGITWKDIELKHMESGQPYAELSGKALARLNDIGAEGVYVSLSDDAGLVSAFAVLG